MTDGWHRWHGSPDIWHVLVMLPFLLTHGWAIDGGQGKELEVLGSKGRGRDYRQTWSV